MKLATGMVKRFNRSIHVNDGDAWAIVDDEGYTFGWPNRALARANRVLGLERIAKILKLTPKTVTVEIAR